MEKADLHNTVLDFLSNYLPVEGSFLLALSGGVDSLTLFYLLLELRKVRKFSFEVAHIDHGWRAESQIEATTLQRLCEEKDIVFHLKRLDPKQLSGNLEEECRKARLNFFKKICKDYPHLQAVMLAHHKDDLAETILKRLFEGAPIHHIHGFCEQGLFEGLALWRPLIPIRKSQLVAWISQKKQPFFEDATNNDPRFLRARLRNTLLPTLTAEFGKEIIDNLCRLGSCSLEIEHFAQALVQRYPQILCAGPLGKWINYSQIQHLCIFEQKMLLKELLKAHSCALPIHLFETIFKALQQAQANRQFHYREHTFYVDRSHLFIPQKEFFSKKESSHGLCLQQGMQILGPWQISVEKGVDPFNSNKPTDWKDLWCGRGEIYLPDEPLHAYFFDTSKMGPIRKWLTDHRVPHFIKAVGPLIINSEQQIVHEFLTGSHFFRSHPLRQNKGANR